MVIYADDVPFISWLFVTPTGTRFRGFAFSTAGLDGSDETTTVKFSGRQAFLLSCKYAALLA